MIGADERVFGWINGFVGTWGWADNVIKLLISDFFLPVLIAAAAWSLWFLGSSPARRFLNQMGFVYAAGGAGFANLFIRLANQHFDRARPFVALEDVNVLFYQPTDPSFPSNAAAYAFAMAAGVFLVHRPIGLVIGVAALLFSFVRVYGGMHFPLDVIGGGLAGVLTTYVFAKVLGLLHPLVNAAFGVARRLFLA